MTNDWSDPEKVERELERIERGEPPAAGAPSDMRLLLGAMRAVLDAQKRTDTRTATLAEDIATLRGLLEQRAPARSAGDDPPAAERGLAQQLAEAEGRIAGHVDHLAEHVRTVADTPKALADLEAAVRTLDEAVRAQTHLYKSSASSLDRMSADLKDMVRNADLGMRHQFAEETKGVREALQKTAAVVLERRHRDRLSRLSVAGIVLLGALLCVGGGVWLQSEHGPLPAHDPTGGRRDYIWQNYGSAIDDCHREAQATGRPFDCRLEVPPPR